MNTQPKPSAFSVFAGKRCKRDAPRTVICLGTPRGGTSMVGGAILGLGVFMGDDLKPNIEDPLFNPDFDKDLPFKAFEKRLPQVIGDRNAAHKIWGWKYPRASRYLDGIASTLINPHLVMVYRDPVPATLRQKLDDMAAVKEIRRRLRMEMQNTQLVQKLKLPTLMVSYERASQQPEEFLTALAGFLQLDLPADIGPIIDFMEPGSYKTPTFGGFAG